jgi:galactokinase
MGSIVVRYPGRACLLGEHCDWAGGASLTIPLPMGIEVRAEPETEGIHIHTDLDGELLEGSWTTQGQVEPAGGPLRFVPAACALLQQRGIELPSTRLWVRSDLPPGRGFSSSASFTLGVLDVLARSSGVHLDTAELARMAYEVEHDLLKVECGRLDPTACAAGEPVFIRWGSPASGESWMDVRRVRPGGCFHLVVGILGRPRDTRRILQTLSDWHAAPIGDSNGDAVREAIHTFSSAAEQGAYAMDNGDAQSLGTAMNTAQKVYEDALIDRAPPLFAPLLRRTCAHARENLNAIGAKFSGAGGDGSFVALFWNEPDARTAALELEEMGLRAWVLALEAT